MSSLFQSIPDGWQRTTLRHLGQGPKNGAWGGEAGEDEIDAVCVRVADFDWSRLTLKLDDPTTRSFKKQQFKNLQLQPGDIVIEKSGGGEKTPVGRVVSFDENVEAVTSNFVARIRPHKDVWNRFFLYLLAAHYMSGYSHQFIKQNTGIQNLDDTNLFRSDVWVPDLATQRQIADFLDRETARIDLLIEKKQRLVASLEEKREEVISNAIIKGLNPKAEMQQTGIPWLGAVPSHWTVQPIKYLVSRSLTDGPHVTPTKRDEGVPFISAESISNGKINFDKKWGHISAEDHRLYSRSYKPQRHDILVVKLGATTGRVARVETDMDFNIWVPLAAIRPKTPLLSKLIYFALQSSHIKDAYQVLWTYGTQQTLGLGTLSKIRLPIPPDSEIEEIANHIETRLPALEQVSERTLVSIDRLREYRSALITAAVTGQIDVTTYAKSDTPDRRLDAIREEMGA